MDILCRVVDNWGDIGVAYRLARSLAELGEGVRLLVEGLEAFAALEPAVDPGRPLQEAAGMRVASWAGGPAVEADYLSDPPERVVECFACGKPDWLEALMYGEDAGRKSTVLNLEYLTAEDYALDFHRLAALTRSHRVRKFFFMPGFGPGTGGLIGGRAFTEARGRFGDRAARPGERQKLAKRAGLDLPPGSESSIWFLAFSYDFDYGPLVSELADFGAGKPLLALAASGMSQACFLRAWEEGGRPFPLVALPFMGQGLWDEFILASDLSLVRGEDSLSRAALSGRPFLWQAYRQEGAYQLVKAKALWRKLEPYLPAAQKPAYKAAFLALNGGAEGMAPGRGIKGLLNSQEALIPAFDAFSAFCESPGELTRNLLTFFREIV